MTLGKFNPIDDPLRRDEAECLDRIYVEGAIPEREGDSGAVLAVGEVETQSDLEGARSVKLVAAGGAAVLQHVKELFHLGQGVALLLWRREERPLFEINDGGITPSPPELYLAQIV